MNNYILSDNKTNLLARNSNIELLRIIAMFLIVLSHYCIYTNAISNENTLWINSVLVFSLSFGKLGVAIFVIISGYFLSTSSFKIERIINVVLQTLFYSILIFVLFCIFDKSFFSIFEAIKSFFPIITQRYWFITAYIILALLHPYINIILQSVSRIQFVWLIIVALFFFSFAPTFLKFDSYSMGGYLGYFVLYYCIGAYFRLYPKNLLSDNKKVCLIICIFSFLSLVISVILIMLLAQKIGFFKGKQGVFYTSNSTVIIFAAASLFVIFTNFKPKYIKFINVLGGSTLGVYLIHENPFMRKLLWEKICNNQQYVHSYFLIIHMIVSVISVYIVCSGIECFRKQVLEKFCFKTINESIINYIKDSIINVNSLTNKHINE